MLSTWIKCFVISLILSVAAVFIAPEFSTAQSGQTAQPGQQQEAFNSYSEYGSRFSNLGAYNEFATAPPRLYVNGKLIGYLTKNNYLSPRIDPESILDWASKNVSRWASI